MIYKIKYSYETGDSFGRQDANGILEMEWENLDNAKTALKRIQEHYLWYKDQNNTWRSSKDKPVKEPDWHRGEQYDFTLIVKMDNGNEVKFCAPWCGYFESLHHAEIFVPIDEELRIEF